MKKLSTHIKGLDTILNGGLQVDSMTFNNSDQRNSLVIVIRGERGTFKHLFAMQLMHGLTMSINKRLQAFGVQTSKGTAAFYSINKSVQLLNDMYLDLLIGRWIDAMTHAVKRYQNDITEGIATPTYISQTSNNRQAALQFWFETDQTQRRYPAPTCIRRGLNDIYKMDWQTMLADNIINYNPRTNSIHYRRLLQGDSDDSLIFMRRHDTIKDYVTTYKEYKADLYRYSENGGRYNFDDELIEVAFDYDDTNSGFSIIDRNSKEAAIQFFKILRKIEKDIDELNPNRINQQENDTNYPFIHEVAVIDGFSHVDTETLKTLPYKHLLDTLRKTARISILVFDDRKDVDCDGDMIIDLRKGLDTTEEYSFYELQISKCIFQSSALGWHQYKRREEGLILFPSIHLLLTKRHYIANRIHDIGKGVLQDSYDKFLESKVHTDSAIGMLHRRDINEMQSYFNEFYYEDFEELDEAQPLYLLRKIIASYHAPSKETTGKFEEEEGNKTAIKILSTVLLGYPTPTDDYKQNPPGWYNHYPSTAVVGNPNSFKRRLVLSHAFHWAKRKEHVLFVLFDKNEEDVRKQMMCPAIQTKVKPGKKYDNNTNKLDTCLNCYKYVHFLRVRSGCIMPDEFFSTLLEQISIYCDEDAITGLEKKRLHVIVDDFQRIDFCFPFIKTSSLFTDALINICHQHNVELTILCDKSGERAREVCTLADNVLCVERNQDDINRITISVERMSMPPFHSAILKYTVSDIWNLFKCSNNLGIDENSIDYQIIGSMKEYWRQTENVVVKNKSKDEESLS